MTQERPILILTCLLAAIAVTAGCPSVKDVAPCECLDWLSKVECGPINTEDLVSVARKLRGVTVTTFSITGSKLGSIPHDVFRGVKLSELRIMSSSLVSLTDTGEAFVGLEDHLKDLTITDIVYKTKWNWSVLRNLKKLTRLLIWNTFNLETIGTDDMKASVPSLETIGFEQGNISVVTDRAFDSYKNLSFLDLSNNKIKNVKRSMLPNPALKLTELDLNFNLLEEIPEDMFTNMPILSRIFIGSNKIQVLDEKTFSPVWEHLQFFDIPLNPLRCDSRMCWLLGKKQPYFFRGECASPPELKGRELKVLRSQDLKCSV